MGPRGANIVSEATKLNRSQIQGAWGPRPMAQSLALQLYVEKKRKKEEDQKFCINTHGSLHVFIAVASQLPVYQPDLGVSLWRVPALANCTSVSSHLGVSVSTYE